MSDSLRVSRLEQSDEKERVSSCHHSGLVSYGEERIEYPWVLTAMPPPSPTPLVDRS